MGNPRGFLEERRRVPPKRSPRLRIADSQEVYGEQSADVTRRQGSRCMDCGIPFCHQGCPLGNEIPDFNELVYRGKWREAYLRLAGTNNFPELTGRLCPAPCEAACVLAINDDPVTIEQIEKEIAERAFAEGWVLPSPPRAQSGKRVAVVGSGPAGLAAAAQLRASGHEVTIHEAADRIGGLLRYGIPDFKLDRNVLDRRLEIMRAEGIEMVTGSRVGRSPTWPELRAEFDAVLIAIGAGRARELDVPGRDLRGVHQAMDYLSHQNRVVAGDVELSPEFDARGKNVVILGGGDTGADCLGTALRQGARTVRQLELMLQPPPRRSAGNPWPQWPLVDRISPSHEEGGSRDFGVLTKSLGGKDGNLATLRAIRVDVTPRTGGGFDLREIAGTGFKLPVDLLILAMGFTGPDASELSEQMGVETDARGNVAVDDSFATSAEGVFCAGDAQRGQSLIVWAISDGREAARAIDAFLRGGRAWLPSRGADSPFGGR